MACRLLTPPRLRAVAAALLAASAVACGTRGKDQTSVIHRRLDGEPKTLNPILATTDAEQRGFIRVTVEINDVKHLQLVMKSIKKIDGVLDVERAAR